MILHFQVDCGFLLGFGTLFDLFDDVEFNPRRKLLQQEGVSFLLGPLDSDR